MKGTEKRFKFVFLGYLTILLCTIPALTGCVDRQTLTVHQVGQPEAIDISAANRELLPKRATAFTLNPGDVFHLEVMPQKASEQIFRFEQGDAIQVSFHYDGGHYQIMPGDRISIFLQHDSPLNMETTVRMDGRITIPRIGEIMAAGRKPELLGDHLASKFTGAVKKSGVTVSVLESNMEPFDLMTGEYFVLPDGSISMPILGQINARGTTLEFLGKKISARVRKKFVNNFKASISARSLAGEQMEVYDRVLTVSPSGDCILPHIGTLHVRGKTLPQLRTEVESKLQSHYTNPIDVSLGLISAVNNSIYVSGEVLYPGIYPLMADMTTLKALSLSGGVTEEGNMDEVVLIHYTSPSHVTVYKTSLSKVVDQASQLHDLALSPQDIVFVPKSSIAEANQFIQQYITRMLPFNANVTYNFNDIQ